VDISGYSITDALTPGRQGQGSKTGGDEDPGLGPRSGKRTGGRSARTVRLPEGAKVPPGGDVWVAHRADGFLEVFGYLPDYEAEDTHPDVPDLQHQNGWIRMAAFHGTVALKDAYGEVVDFVPYDRNKEPKWTAEEMPDLYWKGGPINLRGSSWYGWNGQVLARDRDEQGRLLPDTDTAADWDGGNSHKKLGVEPVHRVELPGQSRFYAKRLKNVRAKVLATSAPDNNYKSLLAAFDDAKQSIRISVYQLTNPYVADSLIKQLRRGVKVMLWLEGSPVAGIPDQERYLVDKLARAGAKVHFLISDTKKKIKPRYRFDHSKYVIIDKRKVIIGSENYGRTGVPVHNSYGNRGWMVHIEQHDLYKQLRAVWDHDYKLKMRDVRSIDDDPHDAYGLPYRKPGFKPDDTIQRGLYEDPVKPLLVHEKMDLELVLSPDTSLNENTAIIGMINRAKKTLPVPQNSVRRRWGRKSDTMEQAPDLPLEAVIAAARRGVKTRVLLDGYWYNITGDDDRDNDDVARMLNEMARAEGLDLSAKVINLERAHLEKIHTKGVIVDEKEVFVGSINWSENSFKGNREVGVVIGNKKVAGYYLDLFKRDWADSRMYEVPVRRSTQMKQYRHKKSRTLEKVRKGEQLYVVGEHGGTLDSGPAWLEVRRGRGRTGFVPAHTVGHPIADPNEALHLLGKRATIKGRVANTRVSNKVIQLRFHDEERPPFIAVIFRNSEARFREAGINPAQAFQGREVTVQGTVQAYKVPEIIISSPDQIQIVR
jgi:phosphatidylserine/phosphatidylglycerophosphate/cardiolipin synthase-like enzyme